jgi:O-antigen/teichoic acid export membrane protein
LNFFPKLISASIDFFSSFVFNLLVFWGITQALEISAFGELAFLLAIATLCSPIIVLSLPNYILLSNDIPYEEKKAATWLYIRIVLFFTVFLFGLLILIAPYKVITVLFVLQSLLTISEIIPRTLWKNRFASQYVYHNVSIVFVKCILVFCLVRLAPSHFIIGVIMMNFLTTIYFWLHFRPSKQTHQRSIQILKSAFVFAKPLLISSFVVLLYTRIDQIMINFMIDSEALAQYSVAIKISDGIVGVWTAIQAFFLHLLLTNQAAYKQFVKIAWCYGLLCCILALLFGDFLVPLIFGIAFQESTVVVQILSTGTVFFALNSIGAIWLQSNNLTYLTPYRSLCGLATNVVGNLILIPAFGIAGAALATVLSQFAVCFLAPFISRRSMKLIRLQILL